MMKILVTGGSGQLGKCIKELVEKNPDHGFEFVFRNSSELDISDPTAVAHDFTGNGYRYCINCAAYTQVDKAETEYAIAEKVNVLGVKNLALACATVGATLIHISTDFVFDGNARNPYTEEAECNPLGVYGRTKWEGEQAVLEHHAAHFILRTSWLYSEYGGNFMKTMLRLGDERDQLAVVDDQRGTPTYAKDLANIILQIVFSDSKAFGVYHYSNEGETSWYGFAKAIFELSKTNVNVKPIPSEAYPTPAKRPKYSVLDKLKVKKTFGVGIPHWEESLVEALNAYKKLTV